MKKALFVVISLVTLGLLSGCQAAPKPELEGSSIKTVSGTVTYRERIALPEDALVTVTLEDISLADAPSKVIAKHRFVTNGEQVPFKFDLGFDSKKIKENHRYSVRATIEVNNRLRFTTDTVAPVITDTYKTDYVDLRLVGVK